MTRAGASWRLPAGLLVGGALLLGACASGDDDDLDATASTTPTTAADVVTTEAAAGGDWWCHPDQADDLCTTADLATTVVDWQLATTVDPRAADPEAPVDCLVVPPAAPDDATARSWVLAEAAPLRTHCRVFVPRVAPGDAAAAITALDEVAAASDRPLFLVGHAEGADLLTRAIQERIDPDEALRRRLLSATLVGGLAVQVPEGQLAGGTFQNVWVCTDRDQAGCVLTWHSYEAGTTPALDVPAFAGIAPGQRAACTHPGGLDGSRGQLRAATFAAVGTGSPGPWVPGLPAVETPYVTLPEYFVAECVNFGSGVWYLRVEPSIDPDDQRAPGPLTDPALGDQRLGIRNLDLALAQGDLTFLLERQLDAWTATASPAVD